MFVTLACTLSPLSRTHRASPRSSSRISAPRSRTHRRTPPMLRSRLTRRCARHCVPEHARRRAPFSPALPDPRTPQPHMRLPPAGAALGDFLMNSGANLKELALNGTGVGVAHLAAALARGPDLRRLAVHAGPPSTTRYSRGVLFPRLCALVLHRAVA